MSLYEDLTEILTPYADKIKKNEGDISGFEEYKGSIIEYERLNLLDTTSFSTGKLNIQNGQVQTSQTSYKTSDYIPVKDVWYNIYNAEKYFCVYDANKQFVDYGNPTYPFRPKKERNDAYVRVSVLNENVDTAIVCELEHYYPDEDGVITYQPRKLNIAGNNFSSTLIDEISNNDNVRFTPGNNLFDINGGYLYAVGQAQLAINKDTGDVFYISPGTMARDNNKRHFDGLTFPANSCIGSTYYIPVQAGKYLFTNYSYWTSPLYDSDKNFIMSIPTQADAFTGYLIPEGVSFIRINFMAGTDQQDTDGKLILHSLSEASNICVWQEDEAICTRFKTPLHMQIDGNFISANYLDKVVPNMVDSDFLSAMKCMTIREINRREHAWRFGNFNVYVGSRTRGYYLIRKMLMDNGVDFCGFEEMSGRTTDLGAYLKSWQFADGFVSPKDSNGKTTNALSIASRFEVQTWNTYTLASVTNNKDCINARIRLPRYMDVYNPFKILSMYAIHPMVGANQQNLANELLGIIANDDSDYIVITSDTNSFGDTEESKVFWRVLEAGGFRPTISIATKTVTQDNLSSESDAYPEQRWRHHSIDQIFISSNIDCVSYNVINTKDEYVGYVKNNTTTDGEYALSDHDFVYADLVFKDEVRE